MRPARHRRPASDGALRLLTVREVADLWQLTEGRVRRLCHAGQIRHIRIGRWIRIPSHTLHDDLHALLDAGQPVLRSHQDQKWNR